MAILKDLYIVRISPAPPKEKTAVGAVFSFEGRYFFGGKGGEKVSIFSSAGKYGCYFKSPHPLLTFSGTAKLASPRPSRGGGFDIFPARRQHGGGGVISDSILLTRGSGEDEYLLSGCSGSARIIRKNKICRQRRHLETLTSNF